VSFIQANLDKYTVKQMCKALKFPRSTYYAAIKHKPSKREEAYQQFNDHVLDVYIEFKKRYGAIKIQRELSSRGICCSVKRVQRHMKRLNIKSIVVKKYQYSKNQGKVPDDKENILNRDFEADTVFKKLVTDITYIHVVNEGWTYLASVMDLYDRKIIGWSYGRNITAELATQAVKNACLNIPETQGIILHSDLGSQYTSDEFESYLTTKGMKHSFSRKGNPYDNACIESFHSILKKEEVYTTTYHTFEDAYNALFEYIESFYNRKRRHSALDYKTPQEVENEALAA
jgi:transposase